MSLILPLLLLASAPEPAGGGHPGRWDAAGITPSRPAMTYSEEGRPVVVLTCLSTDMYVQLRGFAAAQSWPQPKLVLRFGDAVRERAPDMALIGDQTALSLSFPINDHILVSVRDGIPIRAKFNGQERTYPAAPEAIRREFSQTCAGLVAPEMRAGN
jgi:hypothetical protein